MKKAALISVSDRSGLEKFAKTLLECGYELLTTSGSGKFLKECGISSTAIEEYTGQKEILGGRVKTLHPKIHGGLLAKRSDPEHLQQLEEGGIPQIEVAVVNLYPFAGGLTGEKAADPDKMVELIDIGGPTMIRAAAKNHQSVWAVIDPKDYEAVGEFLKKREQDSAAALQFRRSLAVKVFTQLAQYNLEIARYFAQIKNEPYTPEWSVGQDVTGMVLTKTQDLRYGENPHQKGAFYSVLGAADSGWKQFQGKELSYNNLIDFDAAYRIVRSLPSDQPAVTIVKHLNPCGAACGKNLIDALTRARAGDPRSHFGGIIAFNRTVDKVTAEAVIDDFTEIVVAPHFEVEALEAFTKRKNLRVLQIDFDKVSRTEFRSVQGGVLVQEVDYGVHAISAEDIVCGEKLSEKVMADLRFAWSLCAYIKSNAISIVKDLMLIGTGGGQMSRIDAAEVALWKARTHGHDLKGAVAASDAFFPFTDCVDVLAEAGICAIVVPAGAKRDAEVLEKAKERGISLIFAHERHFRH
ncbi:MAG: bifunctional phosphoribosylaminoimidazolecarboxamide formyltransferase/IMP cyclohydrolase [Bdellovibrionota bacterium]|jgi:phosphoribosylaminoimidazolecarboxamide formyltransferase/IMP cyclohydrolase